MGASRVVVIIGAGPAGLAVAACLKRRGVASVLVNRADSVGSAWRRHYDRLHLHTTRRFSQLPFHGFPKETPRWPSRQQVVDYLESYARHFELELRLNEAVTGVSRQIDRWIVETTKGHLEARRVVIATGYARAPVTPWWPGREQFQGPIVHSSEYKNGEPYRAKRVLVVGFGNSGGEIAIDLHEHGAFPALSVRSPVNIIPRQIFGIPVDALAVALGGLPSRLTDAMSAPLVTMVLGDIRTLGFRKLPYGPLAQMAEHRRVPLIDIGTVALIRQGAIKLLPDVEGLSSTEISFSDGSRHPFDAVVAATGYQPRIDAFLRGCEALLDDRGGPATSGDEAAPGLWFCGMRVAATGMLREIGIEAQRIADGIAARMARRAAPSGDG